MIFVLGGVTRGETREAHALSQALGREVIIGGTELLDPECFVSQLSRLGGGGGGGGGGVYSGGGGAAADDEIDLDDLIIE